MAFDLGSVEIVIDEFSVACNTTYNLSYTVMIICFNGTILSSRHGICLGDVENRADTSTNYVECSVNLS